MNTPDTTIDASFYDDVIRPEITTYLEMAQIAKHSITS